METLLFLITLAVIIIALRHLWPRDKKKATAKHTDPKKQRLLDDQDGAIDAYTNIDPLFAFDWAKTKPLPIRPFKPKYHLTMALENMPLSELVAMDNTYLDRIRLRRQIMTDHPEATLACDPAAEAAVYEFYTWMIGTYLPRRLPTCYSLVSSTKSSDEKQTDTPQLLNKITNELIPLQPSSALSALQTLGAQIDTDFLILLPRPNTNTNPPLSPEECQTQPIYHLSAFTTTFPSGFSTLSKLNLPLSAIHAPVPSYNTKLEKSMDRFFARLEVGRAVRRANWTVTTHDKLFTEGGTHLYAGDSANETAKTMDPTSPDEEVEKQKRDVVIENCRLRSERQTLHRLPETKALVFGFKTYLCTLEEVKEDGDGPALAEAIDGFRKGSVPEMEYYKRGVVWGEKVKEYLRN